MFRKENICKIILVIALILCNVVYPKIVKAEDFGSFNVFVDGMNGNDANTGSDETQPVKSWDKAKQLLGTKQGTIYIAGTVVASGYMSTYAPNNQTVKRASGFTGVMFEVPTSGEAYFFNINVDGEDKKIDSEIIKLNNSSNVYFLDNATFYNIGYSNPQELPTDISGGIICSLASGVNILVDGAKFANNNAKGTFFTPLGRDIPSVNLVVKSLTYQNNKGYFYHNESASRNNRVTIYNAIFNNNTPASRYTDPIYSQRTGSVYVCDEGSIGIYETDGVAIFDNNEYDIMRDSDNVKPISFYSSDSGSEINTQSMLGGGNPNYAWNYTPGADAYLGINSNPSPADKENAAILAKSIFQGNEGIILDLNGLLKFGRPNNEQPPETPKAYDEPYVEPEPEPETPEVKIEKYVNKDVHDTIDLINSNQVFEYDIIAYINPEAEIVTITDTLNDYLEFNDAENINSVIIELIGEENNHQSGRLPEYEMSATVNQPGLSLNGKNGINPSFNNAKNKLTIEINNEAINENRLSGKYVRINFKAHVKQTYVERFRNKDFTFITAQILENDPIVTEYQEHQGIANKAYIEVKFPNIEEVKDGSNTVTVDPETPELTSKVKFKKVDQDDKPLPGAEIEIYDENDNLVTSFVSNGNTKELELPLGVYKLHEKKAPNGYDPAEDLYFEVLIGDKIITYVDDAPRNHYSVGPWNPFFRGVGGLLVKGKDGIEPVFCLNPTRTYMSEVIPTIYSENFEDAISDDLTAAECYERSEDYLREYQETFNPYTQRPYFVENENLPEEQKMTLDDILLRLKIALFVGYSNNGIGLKEKYFSNVSFPDSGFYLATQAAVHYATCGKDQITAQLSDNFTHGFAKTAYDRIKNIIDKPELIELPAEMDLLFYMYKGTMANPEEGMEGKDFDMQNLVAAQLRYVDHEIDEDTIKIINRANGDEKDEKKISASLEKKWEDSTGKPIIWPDDITELKFEVSYGLEENRQIKQVTLTPNKTKEENIVFDFVEDGYFEVTEEEIDGYDYGYYVDDDNNIVFTNTENEIVPIHLDLISVKKFWDDEDNKDGIRPEKIEFTVKDEEGNIYNNDDIGVIYSNSQMDYEAFYKEVKQQIKEKKDTLEEIKKEHPEETTPEIEELENEIKDLETRFLELEKEIAEMKYKYGSATPWFGAWFISYEGHEKKNFTIEEKLTEGYQISLQETDGEPGNILYTIVNQHTPDIKDIEIEVSKQIINKTGELPGAKLLVTGKNHLGEDVKIEWISTTTPKKLSLLPGEYVLTETTAPDGFLKAESIDFTILEDGSVLIGGKPVSEKIITMKDDFTKVSISKLDIVNSKELPGAKLVIKDAKGNIVESWTSTSEPHLIEKLPVGKYTLTETSAPEGYEIAETIHFTVEETAEIQKVTMKDKRIPGKFEVPISKVSLGQGQELAGAKLTLSGKDYDGKQINPISWMSEGKQRILILSPGSYTLTENQAPLGYDIAESIKFEIDMSGNITINGEKHSVIVMKDEVKKYDVKISKKALGGKEIPGATMELSDGTKLVETWTSTNSSHTVKLTMGEYLLRETVAPAGYNKVTTVIKFKVEADGSVVLLTTTVDNDGKISVLDKNHVVLENAPTKQPIIPTGYGSQTGLTILCLSISVILAGLLIKRKIKTNYLN